MMFLQSTFHFILVDRLPFLLLSVQDEVVFILNSLIVMGGYQGFLGREGIVFLRLWAILQCFNTHWRSNAYDYG